MKSAKDYIVFPLDVPSFEEAEKFVLLLSGLVGMFKVGLELFIRTGPEIIRLVKEKAGAGLFLDLKLHDIPVTVFRAMTSIANLGVDMTTVHCGESLDMLKAAVDGARGETRILGVTLLTSISGENLQGAGYREEYWNDPAMLVMKKAAMARAAGCHGVVCSGIEVEQIKQAFGRDFLAVTPGIRPGYLAAGDDQRRIVTPADAVKGGADYLVIGRPIRDAEDPVAAVSKIRDEIQSALQI